MYQTFGYGRVMASDHKIILILLMECYVATRLHRYRIRLSLVKLYRLENAPICLVMSNVLFNGIVNCDRHEQPIFVNFKVELLAKGKADLSGHSVNALTTRDLYKLSIEILTD